MTELRLEFTTEPFVIGQTPEHARAAESIATSKGLKTEFGPFGTSASGDRQDVLDALPEILDAALAGGAQRISFQVTTTASVPRRPGIHDALERLLLQVEVEFGASLEELSREGKQRAVKILDERGAFNLRGSVEDVADRLGVSRFTVYNYLNAAI